MELYYFANGLGTFNGNLEVVPNLEHPHSFTRDGEEKRFCKLDANRNKKGTQYNLSSGWKDILVLKTTGSSFTKFHRCENTTLEDATDRIFSTSMAIEWVFSINPEDFKTINFDQYAKNAKQ